jgi:hypothetical protein
MTTTDYELLTRDREAEAKSGQPVLDRPAAGYAPPRLEVLGTLETLVTRTGSPRMLGGS